MYPQDLFTDNKKNGKKDILKTMFDWYSSTHQEKAFFIWGEDERIIYTSKAFISLATLQTDDFSNLKWTNFFNEDVQDDINKHFSNNATDKLALESIHIGVDETKSIVSDIVISCLNMNDYNFYICRLENNTYTKELEGIIVDSQKALLAAQLAAGLVHEIRNPLTSIKGFIHLIQAGIQQKEDFYQVIINEIEHLEKITTELLQIAKPFKGEMKEEYVHELIQDISLVMNIQSSYDHITLDINCDDNLNVICNGPQIKQILVNLILNAMEAMEDEGIIALQAYKRGGFVVIDIIDEGEGVSGELVKELEQPFFTTKEKGTGLGLAITKHLLDLHNAKLEIKQNATKGSTFTVLLPIPNPA